MITPREAHRITRFDESIDHFEKEVDEAIMAAATIDHWPCCQEFYPRQRSLAEHIVTKYRAVGWVVQIVDPQKPGENQFLQFERPTP